MWVWAGGWVCEFVRVGGWVCVWVCVCVCGCVCGRVGGWGEGSANV